MENEKNTAENLQKDWVNSISLEELKKTYRDSVYLMWIGNILHIAAAIAFFTILSKYFLIVSETPEGNYYGKMSICWIFSLIALLLLNKIKANKLIRNVFYVVQGIFALITLYFIFRAVYHSPLGDYCRNIFTKGNTPLKLSAKTISDMLKSIAHCVVLCIIAETFAKVLQHSRSCGTRVFLIPASVVGTAGGIIAIFGMDLLTGCTTIIFFFLMPMVFWIAVRNRNSLFSSHALSHKQLASVLKQKKDNIPESEIVIPEDCGNISKQKTYSWAAWFCLAVFVLYLLYINLVP